MDHVTLPERGHPSLGQGRPNVPDGHSGTEGGGDGEGEVDSAKLKPKEASKRLSQRVKLLVTS